MLFKNVITLIFHVESEITFAADYLILRSFIAGKIGVGILEDRPNDAFADFGDFFGAGFVRKHADFGFVDQTIADDLRDKCNKSVEGQNRLALILAALLKNRVPLVPDNEFRILLAGDDVVFVEAIAPLVLLAHILQKFGIAIETGDIAIAAAFDRLEILAREVISHSDHIKSSSHREKHNPHYLRKVLHILDC